MKKVYIAGAISSSNTEQTLRNLRNGMLAGVEMLNLGYSPYCPHLDYQYNLIQDDIHIDVETYYKHDLEWLSQCDCMLVLEGWEQSKGVKGEIRFARENNIPVYFNKADLLINESTFEENHKGCPRY